MEKAYNAPYYNEEDAHSKIVDSSRHNELSKNKTFKSSQKSSRKSKLTQIIFIL